MSAEKIQEVAKAVVAFLGSLVIIITALIEGIESAADGLTALAAVSIPLGVYAVPNKKKAGSDPNN